MPYDFMCLREIFTLLRPILHLISTAAVEKLLLNAFRVEYAMPVQLN